MKLNKLYIIIIAITLGCIVSLCGILFAEQNKKIAKKANNETIMTMVQNMKEQRQEDQIDLKEQRAEQQKTNEQLYESIQKALLKLEKK